MNKLMWLALLRHGLTAAGGAGLASGTELDQGVGAALTLAGIVWSIIEKKKQK